MRIAILLVFSACVSAASAADVAWTGSNGDWEDATNWSTNPALPTNGDDVAIVVANANPRVEFDGGNLTLNSLTLEDRLDISSGSLVVNDVNLLPGSLLISLGEFSATGSSSADSNSMTAGRAPVQSGVISLPSLNSFSTTNQISWSSQNDGSLLDLSGLQTIGGPSSPFRVFTIGATFGGNIDLSAVTNFAQGADTSVIKVETRNVGSVIDLSSMNDLVGTGIAELSVTDGAEIKWGTLRVADGVDITLGGVFDTSQLTSVTNGSIRAENKDAEAPDLGLVTSVDNSGLFAGRSFVGSGQLRLPLVNSYSIEASAQWEATEADSILDLSAMTRINAPSEGFRNFAITARQGGFVDLKNLTEVNRRSDTSRMQIIAQDEGSVIDLSKLNDLVDSGVTDVIVLDGAEIKWGDVATADQVNFRLGGTFETSQLHTVTNGLITAENGSSNPPPNLSAITNVESTTLRAGVLSQTSGTLALPSLTRYGTSVTTSLRALESGSLLDLSAVRTIDGPDEGFRQLTISAEEGGEVDLSGVTAINQRNTTSLVVVNASNPGSVVDLSGVNDLTNSGITDITVADGGEIRLGSLLVADGIRFSIGGILDTANLSKVTNGSIEVENGGLTSPDLQNVSDVTSSSLRAGRIGLAGRLELPKLESYDTTAATTLSSIAAGSVLDLSSLTTINASDEAFRTLAISATAGGTIDLSAVTKVNQRNSNSSVIVSAIHEGSIVDLSSVNNLTDGGIREVSALEGGEIRFGSIEVADEVHFRFGGTVNTSQLTSITNGSITAENAGFPDIDLSRVTNVHNTSLAAGTRGVTAGTLSLPALQSYSSVTGKSLFATQAGSLLNLSTLQTINAPSDPFQTLTISADLGGHIDLSSVTEVNQPNASSKAVVEASGAQTTIHLQSLAANGAVTEIQATESGQIIFGNIAASNVEIEATDGGQIVADRITLLSDALLKGQGVTGSVTNASGRIEINESTMQISGQYVHGSGELEIPVGKSFVIGGDYDNPAFGSGNSFDSRANIPGQGSLLAVSAGQQITGDVTDGATATPTFSLGNIHLGNTLTRNYGIRNNGDQTSLRGAMTTDFPDAPQGNTMLSGPGSNGSFGPIEPNATEPFAVSVTPNEAGPIPEQHVFINNNFDNVDSQTVTFTATAYRLAVPTASPDAIDFGIVHVGDVLSPRPIEIRNEAIVDEFSEDLMATPSASGDVSDAGLIMEALAPGESNNTSIFASLDTSTPGFKTGNVSINFHSNGAGSSELGLTSLSNHTTAVTGQVNDYATPRVTINGPASGTTDPSGEFVIDFGTIFQDLGEKEVTVRLINDVVVPADDLADGSWTTNGQIQFDGFANFAAIGPGAIQDGNVVRISDTTVGTFEGTATLSANSANVTGFSEPITPLEVSVVGKVVVRGDFNDDLLLDVADIDLLTEQVNASQFSQLFDIDLNGSVSEGDRTLWLSLKGSLPGDTDLNGMVNFLDFLTLAENFETADTGWAGGDFDGDGFVRFLDFLKLAENFGKSAESFAAVPEPSANLLAIVYGVLLFRTRSRRRVEEIPRCIAL